MIQGKHVIVIGAGKTAIDVAVSASQVAASTTLLARRGQVWAPQKVLGKLGLIDLTKPKPASC